MSNNKLTENLIALRVLPQSLRWPTDNNTGWQALHKGVGELRSLLAGLEASCAAAESDHDLSADDAASISDIAAIRSPRRRGRAQTVAR